MISIALPVGATPMNAPRCVPRSVVRVVTHVPSTVCCSMMEDTSGNEVKSTGKTCRVWKSARMVLQQRQIPLIDRLVRQPRDGFAFFRKHGFFSDLGCRS